MSRSLLLATALLCAATGAALAQVPDSVVAIDSVIVEPGAVAARTGGPAPPDTRPITPRAAFIRNMILPGSGHAPFEAYTRGGIYFAGWSANWFMIFRNQVRLNESRNRLDLRREQIAAAMVAGTDNPDSMRIVIEASGALDAAVAADGVGGDMRGLVRSREQQREDWIAWSIFWVLASGIDAYVTAHLADFPAGIDIESHADRSVSVRVDLPVGGRRP